MNKTQNTETMTTSSGRKIVRTWNHAKESVTLMDGSKRVVGGWDIQK